MLEASARAGRETHVLTYAHGAYPLEVAYHVHRVSDFPRVRSLRSGPSFGKLALDARCIAATRRLVEELRPEAVLAHHVEAALAARLAGVGRLHYVAHTSLETELSVYFPRLPARSVRLLGCALDRIVTRSTTSTAAVAPALASRLGEGVKHLPVPWRKRPKQDGACNGAAILYAGNLDAYQGWEELLEALRLLLRVRPGARLLIASESDPAPARREAARRGVAASVDFCRLDGEATRERIHATSDLAWIPRRTEGGLPIKMLDAFARGLPVIATKRATAGLSVESACRVIANDDPAAFATASDHLLRDAAARRALADEAHRYLAAHHSDHAYLDALDELLGRPVTPHPAMRTAPHPPIGQALQAR